MNVLDEPAVSRSETSLNDAAPCVAFVTPHKATYLKPFYESFAEAQSEPWRTLVVWPDSHRSEHPQELLTPVAPNLSIERVTSIQRGSKHLPGRHLVRVLMSAMPRLIVIHEFAAFSLAGLVFAKRHKIPVVVITDVGVRNRMMFSRRARWWHAWWGRWIDGIIAATPAAQESLSGRSLPSIPAYHAVDSRLYVPLAKQEAGPVVFGYLGQLIPRKGLDYWMMAARLLRSAGQENFRLRIIGGGDESWIRSVVAREGMDDKVEWCGFLSGHELREALGSSDVFVLPSRIDSYAAVVHEAACMGLPLIVSKHAGAAESLVREGETGYSIDPADSEAFASKMLALMDRGLRLRMSVASRELAEQLSSHRRGAAVWEWMRTTFPNCVTQSPSRPQIMR